MEITVSLTVRVEDWMDLDGLWRVTVSPDDGPFKRMDDIGLDVVLNIEEQYARERPELPTGPRALLQSMIAAARMGTKSGKGFYPHAPLAEGPSSSARLHDAATQDPSGVTVHDWDAVPRVDVFPGITKQTIVGPGSTVVRYIYQPGCDFPAHRHPDDQLTIVHSGAIEFTVGTERLKLRAGQVAVIPGGIMHGARVTADTTVVTDNYFATAHRATLTFPPAP